MASRPRRSAAKKAQEQITDWADSERNSSMSTRARRSEGGRTSGVSRGPPSSPGSEHLNLTVKVPANKLREATSRGRNSTGNSISVNSRTSYGSEIVAGRRNRGPKKSYVVESDSDEDEEDDEMEEPDAEGDEDDMDVDAEEVQAKKVFTAEELSMRRLEMARRRRNLSEKRNEEVKASDI
ncbi:PAPA-1-like conserved region family protein [Colletotrichum tofieldiae]|nr:PAPA-1-like conserved region family protein [Colletotrichum tofieldiae]GKT77008.1 PAPA-1-like conserved region family protein [Colletotrichum tofieldiae]GKT86618.1 PAPA-1-like conserved region family protein [Colletotrichum tofieldiae]